MAETGLGALSGYLPLILLFAVFYFLLIRPQQVQQRKRREMLASLRVGQKVITLGGIYGTIIELHEDKVRLQIADKVEIAMSRGGIANIATEE